MANAAKIFNPILLAGKSDAEVVTVLHPLADQLKFFGYTRFTQEFIDELKKELPNIVEEANKDHDLDKILPSMQYKSRMEKRIRKKVGQRYSTRLEIG